MRDHKKIYYFLFFERIYLYIPMEKSNFAQGKILLQSLERTLQSLACIFQSLEPIFQSLKWKIPIRIKRFTK